MSRLTKIIIFVLFIFFALIGGAILFSIPIIQEPEEIVFESNTQKDVQSPHEETSSLEKLNQEKLSPAKISLPLRVLHEVFFTSQAPFGAWGNPRFEDGCEEASIFMANLWVNGKKNITQKEVEQELLKLSEAMEKKFGFFEDSSASDTLEFFKEYFKYDNASVTYAVTLEALKKELASGNLVLVPTNGQKLKNPFYTAPGPERHYLVVRGYDDSSGEFITNDPGTKRGERYHYKYDVLLDAIADYPTGKNKPLKEKLKAMIVVEKK